MNVEEFHEIVAALRADVEATQLPDLVAQLRSGLNDLSQSSLNPQQLDQAQQRVADASTTIQTAAESAPSQEFTPRWLSMIADLGVKHLMPWEVSTLVRELLGRNQITPQVASEELSTLATELAAFKSQLEAATTSLEFFSVPTTDLAHGEYDVAVRIPRSAVDNSLEQLGEEFEELSTMSSPGTCLTRWLR